MKNNALRKELICLLGTEDGRKRPAIRRSLREEWLYAVYLHGTAAGDLSGKLREAGWESLADGDWLQLRKAADEPPEGWLEGPFGPEAKCCASLLNRHAGDRGPDGKKEKRMLLKAGEEGAAAYQRACGQIHREWAAALRRREMLPEISTDYFTGRKEG